jgi:very-short-patch-repair endonuclease
MDLTPQIMEMLAGSKGLKAAEIAKALGVDRQRANSILYGPLKGMVRQDKSYRWHLMSDSQQETQNTSAVDDQPKTILSKICRYYLECLSFDNEQGVSTFASSQFDVDYAELEKLPLDDESSASLFTEPDVSRLVSKMNRERFKKTLYLGYPTSVHSFVARTGKRYSMVEPVMLFPMEMDSAGGNATPKFQLQYPQFNFAAIEHLLGTRGPQLLQEVIALGEQLGLNSEPGDLPELDEMFLRLHDICSGWNWVEHPDPENLNKEPLLSDADPGVYNRAVIILGERSSYTAGLETELAALQNKDESDLEKTALGDWVLNADENTDRKAIIQDAPLLEVLPLNTEQRQAVRSAMSQKLTVVTGPPGTGKSQVVTALLVNAAWQNKRVLFASKNNKAVDVVEHRVNGLGSRPILLRLGANEYRQRLVEYLSRMMGMNPTTEDREDYEHLNNAYTALLGKRRELEQKAERVTELRNTADRLEQQVENVRDLFGESCFQNLRQQEIKRLAGLAQDFRLSIKSATKAQQGFFVRMLWKWISASRFEKAEASLETIRGLMACLGLSDPEQNITDVTIQYWEPFCDDLEKRYGLAQEVKKYFAALGELAESAKLEDVDAALFHLDQKAADVCMRLWQKWLKLMPDRLSAAERRLLGDYATVLQLMATADKAGQRAARDVWAKYKRLFPQVMNTLSCWAVTSLSAKDRIPLEAGYFDLVVIDEASQCDIASALPLLYRAKQVVIIGDPNQLKHISPIPKAKDTQLLNRYELLDTHSRYAYSVNSLYDLASSMVAPESLINLRDHHRSHADIIEFSNRHFYDNSLRVATRYDRLNLLHNDEPAVRWMHIDGNAIRPREGGSLNIPEAQKVISIIEDLLVNRSYTGSIGVVSPFRAQVNHIERLLHESPQLNSRLADAEILVDTVHKFQGDERDLMIFSPVVARGMHQNSLRFLQGNGNLFNVAITRARSALIVAGDINAARNCQVDYLAAFAAYAQTLEQQREQKKDTAQSIDLGPEYPPVSNPEQVSDWERWFYKKLFTAGICAIPQYGEEKYRLDFALFDGDRKLDIEVDGERYHREWTGELCRRDRIRNQRLMELGWDVMRFWVYEIRDDTEACVERIRHWLTCRKGKE